jgi:hypothetical protein
MSSSSSVSAPASSAASFEAYLATYSGQVSFSPFPIDCGVLTLHFRLIALGFSHEQSRSFSVQRIRRVRIPEELRKEDLEDVDHVEHW